MALYSWHRHRKEALLRRVSAIAAGRFADNAADLVLPANLKLTGGAFQDARRVAGHSHFAPHIHGELQKLGVTVAQSTISKYLLRGRRLLSRGWKTFLRNRLMAMQR
jgi:hypothetical protein